MATLIPSSNVEAAYEDMFKEITRKLYGEETGNGLHTLGTPVAQVATTGPTAPEGERSFTNLQIDRSAAPTIEYDNNAANVAATAAAAAAAAAANVVIQQQPEGSVVVATTGGNFKSEDHLNTAFGLAALMQNGFATTTTTTGNATGTVVAGDQQQQHQQQQQQQTQIVQWSTPAATGGKLQSYTAATQQQQQQQQQQQMQQQVGTSKSKSKNRNDSTTEVIYTSPSTSANTLNSGQIQQQTTPTSSNSGAVSSSSGGSSRKKSQNNNNHQNGNNANNNNGGVQVQKRYACTHCPYSTDRRDLYTRHENIHKEEKPFQCFACLKQFNRADHVKKHFLRMHRELQYDINKTRRHVSSSSTSNNGGGGNQHAGGRGNVTITSVNTQHTNNTNISCGSPEQKPNIIFQGANVQLDNAFLEAQRQPTSSSMSIAETIEAVATAPMRHCLSSNRRNKTILSSAALVSIARSVLTVAVLLAALVVLVAT
ncbi:unnamed protein product [Ceratitis capitata]|uniref:(Mediterranean fruit fly) hypothetical protein n=1 Tax=Ceratitis capitata TaxID=7213 RepID=A0A811V9X2_CERCA|nr:unnamed protein product [Ceratitis capitata]